MRRGGTVARSLLPPSSPFFSFASKLCLRPLPGIGGGPYTTIPLSESPFSAIKLRAGLLFEDKLAYFEHHGSKTFPGPPFPFENRNA